MITNGNLKNVSDDDHPPECGDLQADDVPEEDAFLDDQENFRQAFPEQTINTHRQCIELHIL